MVMFFASGLIIGPKLLQFRAFFVTATIFLFSALFQTANQNQAYSAVRG